VSISATTAIVHQTTLATGTPGVTRIDHVTGTLVCVIDPAQAADPATARGIAADIRDIGGDCHTCTATCPVRTHLHN